MIEILKGFPENVLAFRGSGQITKTNYEKVLIPVIEKALKLHAKVRLYYEIGRDFDGFELAAVWEDFKVGIEHLTRWERVAVVTDVDWIKHAMQLFGFLMPGEMKVFPIADAQQARAWISAA